MTQRLRDQRRKRAELGIGITLSIKTRSTPFANPIECCGAPASWRSFTHTFHRGMVSVKIPQVLGYECGKCGRRYLLDDVVQEMSQMDDMISRVLHSSHPEDPKIVQVLGADIVAKLLQFRAK